MRLHFDSEQGGEAMALWRVDVRFKLEGEQEISAGGYQFVAPAFISPEQLVDKCTQIIKEKFGERFKAIVEVLVLVVAII